MKKVIIIILVLALFVAGIFLGSSKSVSEFIQMLSSDDIEEVVDPVDPVSTWYAANLPGAEQLCFYNFSDALTFNDVDDYAYYEGLYLGGLNGCSANTDNGYLEVRASEYSDPYLMLFASPEVTSPDAVLGYSADVLIIDFDVWFPQGTPYCYISDEYSSTLEYKENAFSLRQGSSESYGAAASSGKQDLVYSLNCYNEYSMGHDSLAGDLGTDFTRCIHLTLMCFNDQAESYVYVNGQYVCSVYFEDMPFYQLVFHGLVLPITPRSHDGTKYLPGEALEYGSFCLDSFEVVKFGSGDGQYDGLFRSYQTNHSLTLNELLGG